MKSEFHDDKMEKLNLLIDELVFLGVIMHFHALIVVPPR